MSDQDYRAFLEYLFETYVRPKLGRSFRHMYGMKGIGSDGYRHEQSRRTYELLRFIERRYDGPEGPERDFRAERLHDTIEDVRNELKRARHILEDAGYYDAVNENFCEIVAGMTKEHMPPEEDAVMKSLGSDDPNRDLRGMIYMLKARYSNPRQEFRPVKNSLDQGGKQLDQALEDENVEMAIPEEASRPRRWWKGCGQIAQGSILSVANVSIALNALNALDVQVSDETRTWGSIVSVTTGVGLIMSGVGDLRGE